MVKRGRHSGLLLLTNDNRAVILQANRSYSEHVNKNLKYNKHIPFVEKLSIPRGRQDAGEKDYETAVREFIEETGLVFDRVSIYEEPFLLEWQDDCKTFRYTMFVAFLDGTLNSLNKRPNTYNIKLFRSPTNEYKVDLSRQRFQNHELVRKLDIMSLKRYRAYMENRQLPTYRYSNYADFFEFVERARAEFAGGRTDRFFLIILYWYVDSEVVPLNLLCPW